MEKFSRSTPEIFCDELQTLATSTFLQIIILVECYVEEREGFPAFHENPMTISPAGQSPNAPFAPLTVSVLNNNNAHFWAMNFDRNQDNVDVLFLPPNDLIQSILSHSGNSQVYRLVSRLRAFQSRSNCWPLTAEFA